MSKIISGLQNLAQIMPKMIISKGIGLLKIFFEKLNI